MESYKINNIKTFIDKVENFTLVSDRIVFRGQAKQGGLLPGIARGQEKRNTTEIEMEMLNDLKRLGQMRIPPALTSLMDLMILAQHFGMKTRLLDWTSNPLVALWFACSAQGKGIDDLDDVHVYALKADEHSLQTPLDPFKAKGTIILRPDLGNARIVAQQGWFTLHRYSQTSNAFVPLERNPKTKKLLTQFIVDGRRRPEILESLDRLGINKSALMPDLEGLCQYINWVHYKPAN